MLIRPLTLADAAILLDFYLSLPESVTCFFQPWPEFTEEIIHTHLADADAGNNLVLGIVPEDGTIEGTGFLWNVNTDAPTLGIGLRERIQGHGWGRRLMEALLAEADARGKPQVNLTVLKTNHRALNLYQSVGFIITGETKFREEADSWCMARSRPDTARSAPPPPQ